MKIHEFFWEKDLLFVFFIEQDKWSAPPFPFPTWLLIIVELDIFAFTSIMTILPPKSIPLLFENIESLMVTDWESEECGTSVA